jgi:putative transcriptional regulator
MTFDPFKHKISELNSFSPKQGLALIAEPFMEDDYFKRAVVILSEYNKNGAVGFILNNELDLKVNDVIEDFPVNNAPLYLGGPVEPQSLFYIHTKGDLIEGSIPITTDLYWNGNFDDIKSKIKEGLISTDEIKFFLGYSGWSKEQLDDEIELNSWLIEEIKDEQILRKNTNSLWKEIIQSSKKKEINMMANFPEDPNLN